MSIQSTPSGEVAISEPWRDASMNADLDCLVVALNDRALDALNATLDDCPKFAPRFIAWVEHVDLEQNRRQELDYPLQLPDAAINPTGTAGNINPAVVSGRCRNAGSTETSRGLAGHCWSPAVHARRTPGT